MKSICYEYEVGGWFQLYTRNSVKNPHTFILHYCFYPLTEQFRLGLHPYHMTTSHNSRRWNTLYMNEVNLLWVWSGWGALIITYSILQVMNPHTLLLPLWLWNPSIYQAWVASLWQQDTMEDAEYNVYVWSASDMCMKWVRFLNHILQHVPVGTPLTLLLPLWLWDPAYVRLGFHAYDNQLQ
jgi:hypothetical protein